MAGKAGLLPADRDAGEGGSVGTSPQGATDVSEGAAPPHGHRLGPATPQGKEAWRKRRF